MGLYYNDGSDLQMISGRGKAEYGASTIRTGNVAVSIGANGTNPIEVTFDTPMPDANYMVDCTITDQQLSKQIITVEKKTTNGFILYVTNVYTGALSYNVKYTAFKLYTDNEYNGLLNDQRYSTDEIDTGKVWIDGKKIYRKVFNTTSPSSDGEMLVVTLPSDVELVIKFEGTIRRTDLQFCDLNWSYAGITYSSTWIYKANSSLPFSVYQKMESTMRSKPEVIIVEYTKTT